MTTLHLLAIDASTPSAAVALGVADVASGRVERLGGFDVVDGANQASGWLVERILELLASAGVEPRRVDRFACGVGPGTFTGTRVAIATCKGLSLGTGSPVIPLSTLAAIAASTPTQGRLLATLDARRGEVYGALFDARTDGSALGGRRLDRKSEDRCAPLAAFLADLDADVTLVGTGAAGAPPERTLTVAGVTADGLWTAALAALTAGPPRPARDLDAVYLRGSYAELGLNQPKRPFVRSPFA